MPKIRLVGDRYQDSIENDDEKNIITLSKKIGLSELELDKKINNNRLRHLKANDREIFSDIYTSAFTLGIVYFIDELKAKSYESNDEYPSIDLDWSLINLGYKRINLDSFKSWLFDYLKENFENSNIKYKFYTDTLYLHIGIKFPSNISEDPFIINISKNVENASLADCFLKISNETHRKVYNNIISHINEFKEDTKKSVNLIVASSSGYDYIVKTINDRFFDNVNDYYMGEKDEEGNIREFQEDYNFIKETLSEKKPSMFIFYGEPGTGKTSLIKNLICELNREFFIIPSNMAYMLTDPSFISFLTSSISDSVLVIEDAEKILESRNNNGNNNSAVSTILNMSDGIVSDFLNISVIFTFNNISDIDEALLRGGRLTFKKEFFRLDENKSKKLCQKYNKEFLNKPMTLSEIFSGKTTEKINSQKNKIGFI